MSGDERRVLEDGRERLGGVLSTLTAPGGNPISPLFRRAGQPDLWSGAWQANAVGFLQVTQWWVGERLPDGLEEVVAWLDQRITQLDEHQRTLAAGVEAAPPAPPPLPNGAPSPPPPPPSSWGGGGGFSGVDPGQVKRFCHDIDATAEGIAQLGATARAALDDMAGFLPAHAKETAGTSRFDEARDVLQQVARELRRRATLMEEVFVVSSLFGAPFPILGLVAAHVPPPAPAPPEVAGPPAPPPPSPSFLDGSALACLADGKLDGEERRRVLRLLKAACAQAKRDPHSAADFINGVGPEALGHLLATNDAVRKELGCVLGPASGTGRLGFDARAVFLDQAGRLDHDDTLALLEAGRFDPSWVIGYAKQFLAIPVARPTKYYFDRVERTVRLLGRDQATAFAAATDPDIARSLGGLINHVDAGVRRAAEAVARDGLLPLPEDHDRLVAARDAMEAIVLRTCDHPRPSGAARRLVADFLAVNMADLTLLAIYEGGDGRLSPERLSLSRPEYERALAVACEDAAGRAAVLASSTAQLAAVAAQGADAIAAGLTAGTDLEAVKALARSAASTLGDHLWKLGAHLGELGKVNLDVLDDRKRAAKEIATAIGVVGSVLLAGGGMAAGAAGGALKAADTLGGPVASETVTQLTEALEQRLVAADVTNATEFMEAINATIETVMVVALYNQTDAAGGHPLRDHLAALGMGPPPDRFLDAKGNLVLPAPLSADARGRLDEWLKPAEGPNPLYVVSHTFVHGPGGLSDSLTEKLVGELYDREAKE